jgi:hypothetical protein
VPETFVCALAVPASNIAKHAMPNMRVFMEVPPEFGRE